MHPQFGERNDAMMNVNETLLLALEQLGREWEEVKLPQEVLLDEGNVRLIISTRTLASDPEFAKLLQEHAPTYVEQVQRATLKELLPSGTLDKGRNPGGGTGA
jgi:hypothetical protein